MRTGNSASARRTAPDRTTRRPREYRSSSIHRRGSNLRFAEWPADNMADTPMEKFAAAERPAAAASKARLRTDQLTRNRVGETAGPPRPKGERISWHHKQ